MCVYAFAYAHIQLHTILHILLRYIKFCLIPTCFVYILPILQKRWRGEETNRMRQEKPHHNQPWILTEPEIAMNLISNDWVRCIKIY